MKYQTISFRFFAATVKIYYVTIATAIFELVNEMFLLRIKISFVAKAHLTSFTIFETLIINSVSLPQILHKLCIFPKVFEKKNNLCKLKVVEGGQTESIM